LKTKLIGFFITSICTLNCKHCCNSIPYIKHEHTSKEIIIEEIRNVFKIYDYIEHIDFYGGEALLHPDIEDILIEASKYKDKFGFMRVLTNGTLIPKRSLLETIKNLNCNFDFFLDNYGPISGKIDELISLLNEYNIKFRVNNYADDDQYCGGWLDLGDYSYKDYTNDDLEKMYQNCYQAHHICLSVRFGKLFHCAFASGAYSLGKAELIEGEYIDLLDETVSTEKKQGYAKLFGTRPVEACKYCNGFDVNNSPRFPAAEQAQRTERSKN